MSKHCKKYNKLGQEIIDETPMKSYCNFYDVDMPRKIKGVKK